MSDNKLALIDNNQLSALVELDAEKWVDSLTPQNVDLALIYLEYTYKKYRELLKKKKLLNSKDGDISAIKVDSGRLQLTANIQTIETVTETIKDFDFKAAEEFAKKHGYNIPMTPEQKIVIPPCVNYEAMKNEKWFQDNIEQFIIQKVVTKQVPKGTNKITVKFIKDEKEKK